MPQCEKPMWKRNKAKCDFREHERALNSDAASHRHGVLTGIMGHGVIVSCRLQVFSLQFWCLSPTPPHPHSHTHCPPMAPSHFHHLPNVWKWTNYQGSINMLKEVVTCWCQGFCVWESLDDSWEVQETPRRLLPDQTSECARHSQRFPWPDDQLYQLFLSWHLHPLQYYRLTLLTDQQIYSEQNSKIVSKMCRQVFKAQFTKYLNKKVCIAQPRVGYAE